MAGHKIGKTKAPQMQFDHTHIQFFFFFFSLAWPHFECTIGHICTIVTLPRCTTPAAKACGHLRSALVLAGVSRGTTLRVETLSWVIWMLWSVQD